MRLANLKTRLFLDSGDPAETKEIIQLLGFLDGQTTNPSLIAKHPDARGRFERGEKFTSQEMLKFYQDVIGELSHLMPDGSISIEVYADVSTSADAMYAQGKEMFTWIPNAHIKFPTTTAGIEAAERSVKDGTRVNMTLVFSQPQAAAVYAATRTAKKGDVFLSPFIGRLDDRGENGMDFIVNTVKMYKAGDGHVEILAASVRTMEHFLYSLALGADIITAPAKTYKEWAALGMPLPAADYVYDAKNLQPIPYQELDLSVDWRSFDIKNELTDKGIAKFAQDWNQLLK
jgi:transaldolase